MSPEKDDVKPEPEPTVEIIENDETGQRIVKFNGMPIFGNIDHEKLAEDLRGPADPDD